ncbi:hypothetical protein [Rosistilla oblonga]|uniref:hypothetical protein n=1 Tax=Rosistilla oblonga TaxID=2527990 RepID=UPI003A97605A
MHTLKLLAAGLLLCTALPVGTVRAQSLDDAIKNMSDDIAVFLESREKTSVAIGEFDGPDGSTAGRAIQQKLKENLLANNLEIKKLGARMKIRGSFSLDSQSSFSIATIRSTLVDENGREMSGYRERVKLAEVTSLEDLSRIFGLTADLVAEQNGESDDADATSGSAKDQDSDAATLLTSVSKAVTKKVSNAIKTPGFSYHGNDKSKVKASDSSDFVVQLRRCPRDLSVFTPVDVLDEGGFAFAPLEDGDRYQVVVTNNSDHDIAAKVSIDGVNSFYFSGNPGFKANGSWVIAAGQSGVIKGWYLNAHELAEFLITSDEKDAKLPDPLDLGTVTVQFFHAWAHNTPVPKVELLAKNDRGQLQTTQGAVIGQQSGEVRRHFGKTLLASVSIRYSNPDDLPEGPGL